MKLNDPFGRVSSRNEAGYRTLRDRLRQESIQDKAAVENVTTNMTASLAKTLAVLFGLSMLLALFFPPFRTVLVVLNILALLWASAAYFKTRMHLKRYLPEECNKA